VCVWVEGVGGGCGRGCICAWSVWVGGVCVGGVCVGCVSVCGVCVYVLMCVCGDLCVCVWGGVGVDEGECGWGCGCV
jgi:hypothetical protein